MSETHIRLSIAACILAFATMAVAQPPKSVNRQQTTPSTSTVIATDGTDERQTGIASTGSTGGGDSHEVRAELMNVLHGYPPEVGMVLKLDPTLFSSPQYLAFYPSLASFVAAHPEIRTLIEQKRWASLSRVQTETHGKLLDRFTSNEDLLAFIQSPAGRRFLESASIPIEAGSRAVSAPIGRVLWSVQIGLVLFTAGIGFRYVSGQVSLDASQALSAVGTVVLAVGIGFVLSAIVSLALSRWLGLWARPSPALNGPSDAERRTDRE